MTSDIRQQSMWDRLVTRVQRILTSPKTEWPIIANEPATAADIYRNYVFILAAIPAVCSFIKSSIIGISIPFAGTIRIGIVSGLSGAVVSYVLTLVGIFIMALIIDALAPRFGGTKNQVQALKTAAYAYTAYWVAGFGQIIPLIGVLVLLAGGLYSLYLLYLGLPFTMKSPPDRAVSYIALVVVCALVVGIVIAIVTGALFGGSALLQGSGATRSSEVKLDPNSPFGQLEAWTKRVEQANKDYEAAQASGDSAAQQQALERIVGMALGGGGDTKSLPPDQFRTFVPEKLAGLARSDLSVERNAVLGIQMSEAHATYSDGAAKTLNLEITDLGGTKGLMALAAWAGVEQEKQTATGYERTYKSNGQIMHEVWNQKSSTGEYTVVVGNRFMVKVSGGGPSIDTLKGAANAINLAGLEGLGQNAVPR